MEFLLARVLLLGPPTEDGGRRRPSRLNSQESKIGSTPPKQSRVNPTEYLPPNVVWVCGDEMLRHRTEEGGCWMSGSGQKINAQQIARSPSPRFLGVEPFVDADVIAEFLGVMRKTVLDWARSGSIPAHPFGRGQRVVWRFRISEVAGYSKPVRSTIAVGSPVIARLEKQYG